MLPKAIQDESSRAEVHRFEHSEAVLPGARERRLVHRMLYFWAALGADDRLPSIDRLDISRLPEAWRYCFLLAQTGPGGAYVFDHVGQAFAADGAGDSTGCTPDALPECLLQHAVRPMPLVLEERVPVTTGGAFVRARMTVRFRSILLPFEGRASGSIYLLGAANSRQDPHRSATPLEELKSYKFDHGVWLLAKLRHLTVAAEDA